MVLPFGIGDGLVDLAEVVELLETVEGKPSRPVERDQLRDETLRHGVSLDDAEDLSAFRKTGPLPPVRSATVPPGFSTPVASRYISGLPVFSTT